MSLTNKKQKDQAMAQMLKLLGITRTSCNCAICHNLVSLNRYPTHLQQCKGRR